MFLPYSVAEPKIDLAIIVRDAIHLSLAPTRLDTSTNKLQQDLASSTSEESESGSDRSKSVQDDAKFPKMEVATEFLPGGSSFKQYMKNSRNFLPHDSEAYSPDTFLEHIVKGKITLLAKILENHFQDVAQLDFIIGSTNS